MVVIEKELCIGCGACVSDCVGRVIKIEEGKAEVVRPCIECGHCVAICPEKAVSIPEFDMEEVEDYVPETFTVAPENFLHAVKFRRSIRNFKPEPLTKEKLEGILNAGRYTATARNAQETAFVLVQDQLEEFKELVWEEIPAVVEAFKEEFPVYAKLFGGLYRRWREDHSRDGLFYNTTSFVLIAAENPWDAGMAAANMENMAVAEGAGMLYSGYLQRIISASPRVQEWLGIGEKPVRCCMLLGYPAVSYERTAPRKKADYIWK